MELKLTQHLHGQIIVFCLLKYYLLPNIDLIYPDFRFKDSEYVTTMLVVVPLNLLEDWYAKYESLTDMVVPRETSMIFQDSDHALMTVSLFHQVKNY